MMLPHELRTPLNGILAYGEMLAADAANLPPKEVAEMGQVIYDSGKRLERLIENFLIYAQIELLGADPAKTPFPPAEANTVRRQVSSRNTPRARREPPSGRMI